ncbi:MAG: response regulator transcription factor [Myxococcales bacterium]
MRLLIVDDEPGLAESLACVLRCRKRYEQVSTAMSYAAGLEKALDERPDVAILDNKLGDYSKTGTDLAGELRQLAPVIHSLILTADPSPEVAVRALQAGADGFLLKEGIGNRLDTAIDTVVAGQRYIDPSVAADAMLASSQRPRSLEASPSELSILRAIGQGLSNTDIAEGRGRSCETIKAQLQSIYRKLGVNSREEAVLEARRLGWI